MALFTVFYENGTFLGEPVYTDDLTTGDEEKARKRVAELRASGKNAFYKQVE